MQPGGSGLVRPSTEVVRSRGRNGGGRRYDWCIGYDFRRLSGWTVGKRAGFVTLSGEPFFRSGIRRTHAPDPIVRSVRRLWGGRASPK